MILGAGLQIGNYSKIETVIQIQPRMRVLSVICFFLIFYYLDTII